MTVHAYLGERFSRTHENQAFDRLYHQLDNYWGSREERVVLIGNVTCNAHELDAVLLKPDGMAVIDFKNVGGSVTFNENGPWYADGMEVKGGAKANPFKQVQANKFALLNWLEGKAVNIDKSNNWGHIAGLVLFQKDIEFDVRQLPGKIASWFYVADYNRGLEWLIQLSSPGIRLSRDEQDYIVAALNVIPHELPGDKVRVVDLPESSESAKSLPKWTAGQNNALRHAKRLLYQDELEALLITGMTSTGKTCLMEGIKELVVQAGCNISALAPNAALANRLSTQTGIDFSSIYGHLYNFSVAEEDADGCLVHPIRTCSDAPNTTYIVDEAHLVGDSYLSFGDERFGTGHTVSDFLDFSGVGKNKRKLIVLGDPYQLRRGSEEASLMNAELLQSKGIKVQHCQMEQLIDDGSRSEILSAAVTMVSAIREGRFSSLDLPVNEPEIRHIANQGKGQTLQELFGSNACSDSVLIASTHKTVQKTTQWVRSRVRAVKNLEVPAPGDRIELYSLIKLDTCELDDPSQKFVPHGSYGTVVGCDRNSVTKHQQLKGRKELVELRFRNFSVRFDHDPGNVQDFLCLEQFLFSEKPELDNDTLIALRVLAETEISHRLKEDAAHVRKLKDSVSLGKEQQEAYEKAKYSYKRKRTQLLLADPFFNAARIRFAYATTCHHAQGRNWHDVIVDAGYDGNARDNETYFRWLYTAITRSTGVVRLANFIPISPLDHAHWKPSRVVIGTEFKSLFRLPYPKDAALEENNISRPVPEGFQNTTPALINLLLYIADKLESTDLRILRINQHQYQEWYVLVDGNGNEATIIFRYNGHYEVTAISASDGDERIAKKALACLRDSVSFDDPLAQPLFDAVKKRLEKYGIIVEGGVLNHWHFRLTVSDSKFRRAAIKLHYSKEGRIGTIEAEKASDAEILTQLGNVFHSPERVSV